MKKFIDDISALGVECRLLQKLRSVFEPRDIYNMSDPLLETLAAEDPAATQERARLKEKLGVLDSALYELKRLDSFRPEARGMYLLSTTPDSRNHTTCDG